MRSPFALGVRRAVRATQSMVSQIVVSVAAAVCVAFITNAYLTDGARPDLTVAEQPAATTQASTPKAEEPRLPSPTPVATALPALDVEVIADVPEGAGPAQELFPGVPAGTSLEALREAAAKETPAEHRRRFLGIPIPFTSTAGDATEDTVRGG